MCRVSTVSAALSATCVPLHLFCQLGWIQEDDPVPFRAHHPGIAELSQRPDHHLAHRPDRTRQILLRDPNGKLSVRIAVVLMGRGEVEQLARNALTDRCERGSRISLTKLWGAPLSSTNRARNAQVALREIAHSGATASTVLCPRVPAWSRAR